jgi:phage I-like protein
MCNVADLPSRDGSGTLPLMSSLLHTLCRELPTVGDKPPEWIELFPRGPEIVGFDGRQWRLSDPDKLVAAFAAREMKVPLDWEHATEIKGPAGERAPAAAWIDKLEVRDGAVWAHTSEWSPDGTRDTTTNAYKYVSPAFVAAGGTKEIVRLSSVGLTNSPNLHLTEINREQSNEELMLTKLVSLLGLPAAATEADVEAAVGKLKSDHVVALNRAEHPELSKFVPRADYDIAMNRVTTAETSLKTRIAADLDKDVEAAIARGLAAGRVTPATAEYHKASCRREGGLAEFEKFLKAAPSVASPSNLDGKSPAAGATGAMTEDEKVICRNMGTSEEAYIKTRDNK